MLNYQNASDFHTKDDRAFPPHSTILAGCYNHLEVVLIWLSQLRLLELRQDIVLAVLLDVLGICCSQVWLLLAWSHISRGLVQKGLQYCDGSDSLTESAGRIVDRQITGKSICITVYCECCFLITQNKQKDESLLG